LLITLGFFSPDLGQPYYTWYKDLFNRVQFGLSSAVSVLGWLFLERLLRQWDPAFTELVGAFFSTFLFFLTNTSLVGMVIHLASGAPFRKIWTEDIRWNVWSYLILAPVGLFMARAYQIPLVGHWGGYSVLLFLVLLYFARSYWEEKVKLQEAFDRLIEVLVETLEAKDPSTRLHSERVAAISLDLARALRLDESDQKRVAYGARIHDIGKLGIPDAILLKPIRLSPEEYEVATSHPLRGVELLKPVHMYLQNILPIVRSHHERWDGRGYPEGLSGESIPLQARIVQIADSYETMTAGRSYAPSKTPSEALQELEDLAGDQFDPELVKVFKSLWLAHPLWREREEFLRAYTSSASFWELSAPSSPASVLETSPESE